MRYNIKNVSVIGDISKNFNQIDSDVYYFKLPSGIVFLYYHGIELLEHSIRSNKQDAIDCSKQYMIYAKKFSDNSIPFGIVSYIRGKGWVSFTSDTCANAWTITENIGKNHIRI